MIELRNAVTREPSQRIAVRIFSPQEYAFTLIELLTAMAVLALILVMFFQLVSGILQSTRTQNQQMDSVASARRALDVIAADLQNAVIGENTAILVPTAPDTNIFSFLTSRRGTNGAVNHRFLAVRYALTTNNQIIRSYGSVNFGQVNLLTIPAMAESEEPLAKGILALHASALADGTNAYSLTSAPVDHWATNTYNGVSTPVGFKAVLTRSPAFANDLTNRTRAIEFWIVAVDDQSFGLLKDSGNLAIVQGVLGTTPTNWRDAIDSSSIPSQLKSGIRILNKTIPVR